MCALFLDCKGDRLELICIGLWLSETFWHITFTSLLFCFALGLLLLFLDFSMIGLVVFDFFNVLLDLLHDAFYSFDLLGVKDRRLDQLLNRLFCLIRHRTT